MKTNYGAGTRRWLFRRSPIVPRRGGCWNIKIPPLDVRSLDIHLPYVSSFSFIVLFCTALLDIFSKLTLYLAKDFRYTTPILGVRDDSLEGTSLLASKAYHYLASPQELQTRVSNLRTLRKKVGNLERSLIIWEPAPLSCKPENLQACLKAASLVDVFSPNHIELAKLFSEPLSPGSVKASIEHLAARVLERGVGPDQQGVVIIRAGEHGCFVSARDISPKWLPPYYGSESRNANISEVVDPTGAGNTFLGAYAIGYLKTGNVIEAACYGSVGASFAIEQVGLPEKAEQDGEEMWNGVSVSLRLREYMSRHL